MNAKNVTIDSKDVEIESYDDLKAVLRFVPTDEIVRYLREQFELGAEDGFAGGDARGHRMGWKMLEAATKMEEAARLLGYGKALEVK